jgi:hypothetical protein
MFAFSILMTKSREGKMTIHLKLNEIRPRKGIIQMNLSSAQWEKKKRTDYKPGSENTRP